MSVYSCKNGIYFSEKSPHTKFKAQNSLFRVKIGFKILTTSFTTTAFINKNK